MLMEGTCRNGVEDGEAPSESSQQILEDKMGSCAVHSEGITWPELQKACANVSIELLTKGFLQPVLSH